jgi:hypothetical protein
MSDAAPSRPEEEGIPPGKRLVRAGGGAGLSLGGLPSTACGCAASIL